MDTPNRTLGRYKIETLLGSGAFADVYKAVDSLLRRTVALKVLKPALLADEEAFSRFLQEAQIAADLIHPHIAVVWDLGQADGSYFIAMRYVDGPSLDRLLRERGPLPWPEALKIVTDVAAALDYAHARGLVHRDVKPQNVVIGPVDGAVLTDFGLVRALETSGVGTRTGAILGTPQYIPPEVWKGKPATPAADQYALACILVEMLTGKMLYDGPTPWAVMARHAASPELPESWPDGVPAAVDAALRRALAQEPGERFESCGEMVATLENEKKKIQFIKTSQETEEPASPGPESHHPNENNLSCYIWKEVQKTQIEMEEGYTHTPYSYPHSLALSSESVGIVGVALNRRISLYDPESYSIINEINNRKVILDISFAPNSADLAASYEDGSISIWKIGIDDRADPGNLGTAKIFAEEEKILRKKFFAGSPAFSPVFSPDGRFLAYSLGNLVEVWSIENRSVIAQVELMDDINYLTYSRDGQILTVADSTCVGRWHRKNKRLGEPVSLPYSGCYTVTFSHDSMLAACSSLEIAEITVINTMTGDEIIKLQTPGDRVHSMAFSQNGEFLAAGGGDNCVHIWRVRDWQHEATLPEYMEVIEALEFWSDDTQLVTVCSDGTVTIWKRQPKED